MAVKAFSVKSQGNLKISENFKVNEFRCKDGSDTVLIDLDFVKDKLQAVRNHFGRSVTVTSGYRTGSYNKKLGGATNSYHKKGQAFDIQISGITPTHVAQYAESIGVLGIIVYPAFTHLDSRTSKYFSNNSGRSSCSTFGGNSSPTATPDYSVGKTYTLQTELKVRTGPGTNYQSKSYEQLTSGGQSSDKDKDGALDKGTRVTCQQVQQDGNDVWIKCPSGWLAAYYNGNTYVK